MFFSKLKSFFAAFALVIFAFPIFSSNVTHAETLLEGDLPTLNIEMEEVFYTSQRPLKITLEVSEEIKSVLIWMASKEGVSLDIDDDGVLDGDYANTYVLPVIETPEPGTYQIDFDGVYDNLNGNENVNGESMFDYDENTPVEGSGKRPVEGEYTVYFFGFDAASPDENANYIFVENHEDTIRTLKIIQDDDQKLEELPKSSATCMEFVDVQLDHPACEAILYVKEKGVMTGYDNGNFGPDDILNRAQIVKIVLELYGLYNAEKDYTEGQKPFPDVELGLWYTNYISLAKELGIAKGNQGGENDGLFLPGDEVNRVEFLAFLLRQIEDQMPEPENCYDDVDAKDWFSQYACFSKAHNLLKTNGANLSTSQAVQRHEVATAIYQMHQAGLID